MYPGLAVAHELLAEAQRTGVALEVLYVGGKGGVEERLVAREGLRFASELISISHAPALGLLGLVRRSKTPQDIALSLQGSRPHG